MHINSLTNEIDSLEIGIKESIHIGNDEFDFEIRILDLQGIYYLVFGGSGLALRSYPYHGFNADEVANDFAGAIRGSWDLKLDDVDWMP